MIAEYYGKVYSLQYLRERSHIDREGVSLLGISEAAESIGLRTLVVKIPFEKASEEELGLLDVPLPAIAHWEQNHFIVVIKANKKFVWVADPYKGKLKLSRAEFERGWYSDGGQGVLLLLETSPDFYAEEGEKIKKTGISFLFKYFRPYKKLIGQLLLGLVIGSIFQLAFPFLTQAVVDIGIDNQDINFIYLILVAQLMLFLSQTAVNIIQSWILLHIGARVNISILSDFLIKLMRLPIAFFDSKMTGDLLQRVNDHDRIKLLLTTATLATIFSSFNLVVFGVVLAVYNWTIFSIFLVASLAYLGWITFFLKKRKVIDYQNFEQASENRNALIELIQGMQEIKLQNSERRRRWQWMNIQAKIFRVNIKALTLTQYQDTGAAFITQLKDIIITFFAAKAVIDGQMTLGMMLAVQYIIGQLNAPLQQMSIFIRNFQDAEISLERLGEIHNKEDEESSEKSSLEILPEDRTIRFERVSFQYNKLSDLVLEDIDLEIPQGKVTAIVGTSGSGKTTLIKLMLGFYPPSQGRIRVGGISLENINKKLWRHKCGAVMQDGYIFSDTIANNISESEGTVDKEKLLQAVKTANIQPFIENLPLHYNTIIGAKGNGVSQGQRQRILIARAVYKNPEFIFFDEATNALDAKNERIIVDNMNAFFEGRTVVVVAHRLSTVRNADQIIVLEQGRIVERGTHNELVGAKGSYFHLVKDQLELGA
jgi:ATP-binding cassette subfamily B protein